MSSTSTKSKHFISLDQAKKMTKKFRGEKKKLVKDEHHAKEPLPVCETFERAGFDALLAQPGCVAVRCYYSMDDEMKVHLVIVGVNEKDEDIIPNQSSSVSSKTMSLSSLDGGQTEAVILENANRCPTQCPPPSDLNTD